MAHHTRIAFGVLFPCLLLGVGPGCKTRVPQPDQVQTAGMRIDVTRVDNDKRRKRLDVRLRLWNDHDQRISFDLGNVRLLFNGREVSAQRSWTNDRTPDVQAKGNREFRWYFELGEEAGPGTYQVEIRDIQKGDIALGETAAFAINV
jgi:hypothetical protein